NLSPRRSQAVPDIPTSDEGGVAGLYMSGWFGFFAPKNTPKDVIAKLNGAMVQVLQDPGVRARFTELGLDIAAREQPTPDGLAEGHEGESEMVAAHQGGRRQGGIARSGPCRIA